MTAHTASHVELKCFAIPLRSLADVLHARRHGRELAALLHFSESELTVIATVISEIARNTVVYATGGHIRVCLIQKQQKKGLMVVVQDFGPGIPDLGLAMQPGYSTGRSLGIGLPGANRLMDEFDIASEVGKGTIITMKKWKQ